MKVTIAGANSFIGKRMIAIANNQSDIELTLVVKPGSSFDCPKDAKVVECLMEDYKQLGGLVEPGDVFVNLSWLGSRGNDRQNSEMQRFSYECNMNAMRSLANIGYKTLISAGSQAEYGQCHEPITEETPLNANTEYGKYKSQVFYDTTELAKKYDIKFIEPRFFSLYGPGDYCKTLIMSCVDKMKRNVDVDLNECTQLWDYLYVDDAVEGVYALCRNEKANGAYNFATGHHRKLKDYVMDIHDVIGSRSRVRFGVVEYNGLYIDLQPIVEKLKNETKWECKTSFCEGIRKTVGIVTV